MQVWINKKKVQQWFFMIFFCSLFSKQFEFTACRKYDKIFRHMEKYHKLCKPHVMLYLCTPLDILVHLFISWLCVCVCAFTGMWIWMGKDMLLPLFGSRKRRQEKKSFQISCLKNWRGFLCLFLDILLSTLFP